MRALSILAMLLMLVLTACSTADSSVSESDGTKPSGSERLDCTGDNRTNVGSAEANGWEVCNEVGLPAPQYRGEGMLPEWYVRAKNISDEVFPDGDAVLANLRDSSDEVVASVSCYSRADDISPGDTVEFLCSTLDRQRGIEGGWDPPTHSSITLAPLDS